MSKIITLDKKKNEKQIDNFLKRFPEAEVLKDMSMFDIFEDNEAEKMKKQYEEFYKEVEEIIEENRDADGFCDDLFK
ncbi:hypothetical protein [Clostridium sp. UBA1652]|uniref:hypothetical protein n=1 Tax=Clostridium sp. UBA1652 TaxID=1946348 RepID=UPI0025800BC8|nr:hypothetical protein [Clostridium sp. UBA1652]